MQGLSATGTVNVVFPCAKSIFPAAEIEIGVTNPPALSSSQVIMLKAPPLTCKPQNWSLEDASVSCKNSCVLPVDLKTDAFAWVDVVTSSAALEVRPSVTAMPVISTPVDAVSNFFTLS